MWSETSSRQTWLLTAMAAPLLYTLSGCSWVTVAGVGAAALLTGFGLERLMAGIPEVRFLGWLRDLLLILVLARVMQWIGAAWNGEKSIPLVLLVLALWTGRKGEEAVQRGVLVLRWSLIGILGAVFLASAKEVKLANWEPVWNWDWNRTDLLLAFFIPFAAPLPKTERQASLCKVLGFALLTALLITGVMSIRCAENSFYELSRSLTLFGVAKRLESLTSVALTVGYYALLTWLLQRSGENGGKIARRRNILGLAGAILYLFPLPIPGNCLPALAFLGWLLLPAIGAVDKKLKNMKKPIDK